MDKIFDFMINFYRSELRMAKPTEISKQLKIDIESVKKAIFKLADEGKIKIESRNNQKFYDFSDNVKTTYLKSKKEANQNADLHKFIPPVSDSFNYSDKNNNIIKFIRSIESVLHNHNKTQYLIYTLGLMISCFFVGQLGFNLADNLAFQILSAFFLVFIEIIGQFCLSRAKYYHSIKSLKSIPYYFIFGVYIIFFSIPSGVGFFNNELSHKTAIIIQSDRITDNNNLRLSQISNQLSIDYKTLDKESGTGYGLKYKSIQSNINDLTDEQSNIFNKFSDISVKPIPKGNYFQTLSNALWHIPEDIIRVWMFAVALVLLQFAMIICCPIYNLTRPHPGR